MDRIREDEEALQASGRKKIIYLATPYSHPLRSVEQRRFEIATIASGLLIKAGIINFSPITQSHEQNRLVDLPGHWDFWQFVDIEFLHRCDEMYVLAEPGWQQSKGVTAEIEFMRTQKKPIRFIRYYEEINELGFITEEEARSVECLK